MILPPTITRKALSFEGKIVFGFHGFKILAHQNNIKTLKNINLKQKINF
jgi:hypothetical protein